MALSCRVVFASAVYPWSHIISYSCICAGVYMIYQTYHLSPTHHPIRVEVQPCTAHPNFLPEVVAQHSNCIPCTRCHCRYRRHRIHRVSPSWLATGAVALGSHGHRIPMSNASHLPNAHGDYDRCCSTSRDANKAILCMFC